MKYRRRIYYTEAGKALMWERWRQGESLHAIARLFDRHNESVGGILARSGGIRPRSRRRSARALALTEREEILRGAMAGLSARAKGMDLSDISQSKLNAVARRLNERPRKTLAFETPAERFSQCVASIG